jgi:large subunit ribosomal protein L22
MVTAKLSGVRGSARKARLVADLHILGQTPKRAAHPMAKLLRSALANAEQKNEREKSGIDVDNLVVREVRVDEGPSSWRIRPRAQGRAYWIQKRSSHYTLVLGER